MPPDDRAAVRAALPQVARWAEEVAALGLPLTLCHNDLHGHNVFDVNGELRFFDFADALVMEPMAALLVPLNALAHRLRTGADDPRLWRVADAALEVWSEYVSMAELRAALPAALQLGRLARTESWIRCTAPMNDAELAEWGEAAAYWLASLAQGPPVGRPRA
jgi:Ser/Thr protein kinase RdoA (MazF antagonist)